MADLFMWVTSDLLYNKCHTKSRIAKRRNHGEKEKGKQQTEMKKQTEKRNGADRGRAFSAAVRGRAIQAQHSHSCTSIALSFFLFLFHFFWFFAFFILCL